MKTGYFTCLFLLFCSTVFGSHTLRIDNLVVDHRYGLHPIEVTVTISEEVDFEQMRLLAIDFMHQYPNQTDYWEIFNKNMALYLMEQFSLSEINSKVKVYATPDQPHDRWSNFRFPADVKEHFSYEFFIGADKAVLQMTYVNDIESYPNFFLVKDDLLNLLETHSLQDSLQELMKKYTMVRECELSIQKCIYKNNEREDFVGLMIKTPALLQ